MKKFVLLRGVDSRMLYLYPRETWESMKKSKSRGYGFEFVTENDDPEVLEGYQKLVNKDMEGI